MIRWKNAVQAAREALDEVGNGCDFCGTCRSWAWPTETCNNSKSPWLMDYVRAFDNVCEHYSPARGCLTCRHYLEGGQCDISLEQECRDGGFEAWEAK